MNTEYRPLVGYVEAAKRLGVERGTLYSWVHRRRVPFVRFGPRAVRFDLVELDRWIMAHRVCPVEED